MGWFGLNPQEERYWQKFKVGDQADIILEMDMQEIYRSRIEKVSGDSLYLQTPRSGNLILEIQPKTPLVVKVYIEGGIFKFKSKVISQDLEGGNFIQVAKPRAIEHLQRRQYYRLNVILPLECEAVSSLAPIPATNISAVTRNISEGGLMIVIDQKLSIGTLLKIRLHLEADIWVKALAKVLGQEMLDVQNKFLTRLIFTEISEDDQERIRFFIAKRSCRS